jgi:hypothetical protein
MPFAGGVLNWLRDRRVCGAESGENVGGDALEDGELGGVEGIVEADVADAELDDAADLIDELLHGVVVADRAAPSASLRIEHGKGAAQRRWIAVDSEAEGVDLRDPRLRFGQLLVEGRAE